MLLFSTWHTIALAAIDTYFHSNQFGISHTNACENIVAASTDQSSRAAGFVFPEIEVVFPTSSQISRVDKWDDIGVFL
jgi:hypothetical protein